MARSYYYVQCVHCQLRNMKRMKSQFFSTKVLDMERASESRLVLKPRQKIADTGCAPSALICTHFTRTEKVSKLGNWIRVNHYCPTISRVRTSCALLRARSVSHPLLYSDLLLNITERPERPIVYESFTPCRKYTEIYIHCMYNVYRKFQM